MKMSAVFKGGILTVFLAGELDHHGAKEMMSASAKTIEDHVPRKCVLDFKDVSFMDSSGVAFILNVRKRVADINGVLAVENMGSQPMKVVRASGIDRIISIKELLI